MFKRSHVWYLCYEEARLSTTVTATSSSSKNANNFTNVFLPQFESLIFHDESLLLKWNRRLTPTPSVCLSVCLSPSSFCLSLCLKQSLSISMSLSSFCLSLCLKHSLSILFLPFSVCLSLCVWALFVYLISTYFSPFKQQLFVYLFSAFFRSFKFPHLRRLRGRFQGGLQPSSDTRNFCKKLSSSSNWILILTASRSFCPSVTFLSLSLSAFFRSMLSLSLLSDNW